MKIETVTCKGVGKLNEDSVIINDDISIYGVADGVSSIVPFTNQENETGGYIASNLVKNYYQTLHRSSSFLDDFAKINTQLQNKMNEYNVDTLKKEQLWGTALALVKISPYGIDFIQTGDCMIFAVYEDNAVRTLTRAQTAPLEKAVINRWKELIDKGVTKQAELMKDVKEILITNRQKSNTPAGYGVLNGEDDAVKFTEFGKINKNGLKHIVMMTDGLFLPKELVPEHEHYWEVMVNKILSKGLQAYVDDLIELESSDPECVRYPRFKMSDDKAGIWITF
ncbi:protein phosphatase 2C domain-containing protein [Virgibacillus pantothenticus]|uniref:protein phosphatase 2C domain-containing protein n=1 Tax=Virgibacillus pantothenticus TaxID=1473 RepID=UPI0009841D55|nr:protein phosphatase 2C domain-containing protein [Virgibacillus pantothenticus]